MQKQRIAENEGVKEDNVDFTIQFLFRKKISNSTFLVQKQRIAENEGVTEDDVNEIKNDISAFRSSFLFELIFITTFLIKSFHHGVDRNENIQY